MMFTYRVLLKPKNISFRKKLLPSSFDNGIPLRETLQQLVNEEILLEDIPTLDVVWCSQKWSWYTLNNRRLWVLKELEKLGKCQYIATKRVDTEEFTNDSFRLYTDAELIGETSIVNWNSQTLKLDITVSGCTETPINSRIQSSISSSDSSSEDVEVERSVQSKKRTQQRNWRESTPLTIEVIWEKKDKNAKRERKDSGISEIPSEEIPTGCETESTIGDDNNSGRREPGQQQRDNVKLKQHRYKPYRSHRPVERRAAFSPTSERYSRSCLREFDRICQRKIVHDRGMFMLHHDTDQTALEKENLKRQLMNTCGFCFKSFKVSVSLSQHVEQLRHWACIRCGKYFNSYTALGQHILSLDHCVA